MYLLDLRSKQYRLLSRTQAFYEYPHWASDSRHIFFWVQYGSVEGEYQDVQPRAYWVEVPSGSQHRWAAKFPGAIWQFAVTPENALLAAGQIGLEVQLYLQKGAHSTFARLLGWPGTYGSLLGYHGALSSATHSRRIAFVYSDYQKPMEVYLAENPERLEEARPISTFNHLFTQRSLPRGKRYRWMADDGTEIEGTLTYPPGKFGELNLPMLTLIHGGPQLANTNCFEGNAEPLEKWAMLAATDGWLVLQPNYRGSTGYGDQFTLQVIHTIVSRPGKDILEGINALVKDGIANPKRLAIGGYSWGGYLTNWLITQTTRFNAAVSGAGAVEHAVNWGNEYWTSEASYFLGGAPWDAEKNYNDEAAIWLLNSVRTPTHIVTGTEDVSVHPGESYVLERALHALGVPTSLLIFPGEGHSLGNNPWHGKIKVREELAWLKKYGGAVVPGSDHPDR
jgi:dipeptidyl aminopeptidase/acylaminoacyl peptidase